MTTQVRASSFPQLKRVFSGYLHEDLSVEHGTPESALRSFQAEASPTERQRFEDEAERFLARTAHLHFDDVRLLLSQLGCRWTPPSRDALIELLSTLKD